MMYFLIPSLTSMVILLILDLRAAIILAVFMADNLFAYILVVSAKRYNVNSFLLFLLLRHM